MSKKRDKWSFRKFEGFRGGSPVTGGGHSQIQCFLNSDFCLDFVSFFIQIIPDHPNQINIFYLTGQILKNNQNCLKKSSLRDFKWKLAYETDLADSLTRGVL